MTLGQVDDRRRAFLGARFASRHAVFYFFQRGSEYTRCEINEGDGGFVIIITDPKGVTRREQLRTSNDAYARFLEIQADFKSSGWWGPHGRE